MAVCSILYQLATRPEEQEKIHEELMRIAPDSSVPLTTRDLDQAHYMKAFIKEVFRWASWQTNYYYIIERVIVFIILIAVLFFAFRMYSTVIGNGRTLQNDMVICGYHVPKGASIHSSVSFNSL